MIDRHHPDPADRAELTQQDLAIAALVGRYIERREAGQPPRAHDLFAVTAEFGKHRRRRAPHRTRLLRGDARNPRPGAMTQHHRPHATQELSHARADQPAVGTLGTASMSASNPSPIVTEVVRFEDLPPGSRGTRRAVARWSDGTESVALTWYADETPDLRRRPHRQTRQQLRSVHFRRDRDWLQS